LTLPFVQARLQGVVEEVDPEAQCMSLAVSLATTEAGRLQQQCLGRQLLGWPQPTVRETATLGTRRP
jgi:hypothetical protein